MENRLTRTAFRRAAVAFAPAVLLIIFAILLAVQFKQTRLTREQVGRSREAALAAERVFSDLKDAESGNRGFLILGDEQYLTPYLAALGRLTADTLALRALLTYEPLQIERLDSLATLIDARLALLSQGIELRRAGQVDAATQVVRSGAGLEFMQRIRGIMNAVIEHERADAHANFAAEVRITRTLTALFAAGVTLLLVLGYMVNRALLRFAAARAEAAEQIRSQHHLLQDQAIELEIQRDHLQEQNVELEVQQDHMQKQAVEMELQQQELQQRAAELEALNNELQHANVSLDAARIEAEQANRAKSQFLAAMSHELRTPLNAIGGYVDLVEAGVYGELSKGQLDAMARVKSNQQHLLAVISDIMSYAGIAAGTLRVRAQPVPVQPLIAEIERIIHPVAREQNLALVIQDPSSSAALVANADPARMRQILVNLMTNAVKFTPPGGSVVLAYRANHENIEIEVQDTGRGIAADKLDIIFEPFVQLDRSSYEPGGRGGIGLGLALSRELARGMGGDVIVRSTLGAGSVFTLRVPLATQASAVESMAKQLA
jgi:signal transduction histidine kinase